MSSSAQKPHSPSHSPWSMIQYDRPLLPILYIGFSMADDGVQKCSMKNSLTCWGIRLWRVMPLMQIIKCADTTENIGEPARLRIEGRTRTVMASVVNMDGERYQFTPVVKALLRCSESITRFLLCAMNFAMYFPLLDSYNVKVFCHF